MRDKLVLGTANFGNPYGIANKGKSITHQDSKCIINWTQSNGIRHFDTASTYGDAEEILGMYLDQSLEPVIDTKLDAESCKSGKSIVEATRKSWEKLRVSQISTLYLHVEGLLQSSNMKEIALGLNEVLNLGLARQIGVSVYSETSVLRWKNALPKLTVFQVPENICDRRLITSKAIEKLHTEGNTFIVRSVFLQGLLLMDLDSIPKKLNEAKTNIRELNAFSKANSLTPLEMCLAYADSITWASGIVIGFASLDQLKGILENSSSLPSGWDTAIRELPAEIIDPRRWS